MALLFRCDLRIYVCALVDVIDHLCFDQPRLSRETGSEAPRRSARATERLPDLSDEDEICPELPRIQSAFAQDDLSLSEVRSRDPGLPHGESWTPLAGGGFGSQDQREIGRGRFRLWAPRGGSAPLSLRWAYETLKESVRSTMTVRSVWEVVVADQFGCRVRLRARCGDVAAQTSSSSLSLLHALLQINTQHTHT